MSIFIYPVIIAVVSLYLAGALVSAAWILWCHITVGGVLGMLRRRHGLLVGTNLYRNPTKRLTYRVAAFMGAVEMTVLWPYYVVKMFVRN